MKKTIPEWKERNRPGAGDDLELEKELREETPPESEHHRPPLWLLLIWAGFFLFTFYYLYKYMVPDLRQWLP